jgi:hypothetical protein
MESDRTPMIYRGNTHLGPLIHTFSLPAFATCPGSTLACLAACYALGNLFRMGPSLRRYQANWENALDEAAFARSITAEIRWKLVKTLRIHVAGDFFSIAYIRAWIRIAKSCKQTRFLFYTRSWRVAELRPHLIELASLPNVFAWWSEDRDTGPADMPVGRRCFLCVEAADEALVPPGVLVFREDVKTARKWLNGSWVCPKEQGTGSEVTCSSCLRCLVPGPLPVPQEERKRGRDGSASQPTEFKAASA